MAIPQSARCAGIVCRGATNSTFEDEDENEEEDDKHWTERRRNKTESKRNEGIFGRC